MRWLLLVAACSTSACASRERGSGQRCDELDAEAVAIQRKASVTGRCASDDECTRLTRASGCAGGTCEEAVAKQDVPAIRAAETAAEEGPCAQRERAGCPQIQAPVPSCLPGEPTCVGGTCVLHVRPPPVPSR